MAILNDVICEKTSWVFWGTNTVLGYSITMTLFSRDTHILFITVNPVLSVLSCMEVIVQCRFR